MFFIEMKKIGEKTNLQFDFSFSNVLVAATSTSYLLSFNDLGSDTLEISLAKSGRGFKNELTSELKSSSGKPSTAFMLS